MTTVSFEESIAYYQQEYKERNVYVVIIYRDIGSPIDFSVYRERRRALEEAKWKTGGGHVVNAAKDVPALSYVIGEELMAEIHEKRLR